MSDNNTKKDNLEKNKRLLSSEERAALITRALNEGMVNNKKREMKIQKEQQIHTNKEKLIIKNTKASKEDLSRMWIEALKEGIRESNNDKEKKKQE